jgi:hypothetical protein
MTQPQPQDVPRITVTPESAYQAGLQVPVPRGPIGVEKPQDDDVPLVELAKAAARRTNTVGALLDPYVPKDGPSDAPANWNPFSFYKTHEKQFADIAPYVLKGQFDAIFSERDFLQKADVLRRQMNDQRTLERGGTVGLITELGVGLLDPTNLLPIMPLNAVSRFGNALRLGTSLAGQAALQEGILHAVDPTRTATESAMGIIGAGVLGAGIGSFYKHFDVPGTRFHPDHPENPLLPENLDDATVVSRGVDSDKVHTTTPDSVGAARARADEIEKAVPGNAALRAIQNGIDKVLDHASPLARVWEWPSSVGRRIVAGTMDLGGRLTKGMNEGKALPNAEAEVHLERQYLRGYQDQIADHYRGANMDMGQSAVSNAAGNMVEEVSQGALNTNRIHRQDFESAVVNLQAAKKLEAYGHGNQMVNVERDLRAAWAQKGFTPEQVEKIMARTRAASTDLDKFHERYKQKAIDSGLWDGKGAQADGLYGFAVLYNSGAINANPGLMRSLLIRRLTDNPADDFLAEFATRPRTGPDGKPLTLTPEDVKNDPRLMDEARLEWRGDQENAAASEAASRLDATTRKVRDAKAEFDVIQHGVRVADKERKATSVAAIKAQAREAEGNYFARRLGTAERHADQAAERIKSLTAKYPDVMDFADDIVRQFQETGVKLDHVTPKVAAARETKTEAAGLVDFLRGEVKEAKAAKSADEITKARAELQDALAARKEAVADLKAAQAELTRAAQESRNANRWMDAVARKIEQGRADIHKAAEGPGVKAALADELERVKALKAKADELVALRKEAAQTWREVRAGGKLSRRDLRSAMSDNRRAKAAQKRIDKATPMEVYIDAQLTKMRGGGQPTNGLLIEKLPDSNRFKEVSYKWTPDELRELMSNGLIETDLNNLMARYHRDLTGRIALHRSIGTSDPGEAKQLIAEDYVKLIEKYRANGDHKTAEKLVKVSAKNQADAELMMNKALGRVRPGGEGDESVVWWADKLRTLVYLGAAGSFIMSALNDSATGMLVSSGALVGLIKHGRSYGKILKAARTTDREDMRQLRVLLSSLEGSAHLPSEGNMLGELAKDAGGGFGDPKQRALAQRIDRTLKTAGDAVNRVTGLAAWSDHVRRATALTLMNEVIHQAKNLGTMTPVTRAKFASLGLGTDELEVIGKLSTKHGEKWNNLTLPGTHKWLNEPEGQWAAEAFERALVMAQRRASYVPGYGAVPNIMSKWWGALLGQFQSYGFQFTHSFVQAGTQRLLTNGDMQVASAFAVNLGLTALISSMRAHIRGEDTDTWDKRKWANELVTRSGMLGWTAPYADAGMKLIDPKGEFLMPSSKFRQNNAFESLAGPTAGYVGTLTKGAMAAREGDTETLKKQLTRIAPLHQNAAMLTTLADDLFNP